MDDRVEGTVERVTYSNEESGWTVLRLLVPGRRDALPVIGNLPGAQPGEWISARGQFRYHPDYGEQFHAESYRSERPGTLQGIQRYLGSGLVRGVGAALAARIAEKFGLQTLDVIDSAPERLREVEGIGPVRSERIQKAWAEQRQIRDVMVFLQSHGVSPLLAVRIFRHYGDRAIEVVQENPYRLAEDVFGIGFKTADRIARSLGVEPSSPRRIQAGARHVLGQLSDEGHVCAPEAILVERAAEALEAAPEAIVSALQELAAAGDLVREEVEHEGAPTVLWYSKALHSIEVALARALAERSRAQMPPLPVDAQAAIAELERRSGLSLAPEQREAMLGASRHALLVVTGGPGTGKTTLIKGLLQLFDRAGLRTLLAAPTGRAAKRMSEATSRDARTIHRLLEFSASERRFLRDRDTPLDADAVILDEVSMVDASLAWSTVRAIPPAARLVLVGDVDQLPSVGPGAVLADVIRSGAAPVVRLQHVFRQAHRSEIISAAHGVNEGRAPRKTIGRPDTDFYFIAREEPEQVAAMVKELVKERIPRRFGLDSIDDVQVLTPMQRGLLGAANLNAELQALLNPEGEELVRGARVYRQGDKVMQLRNNYDLEVFNGDVGRIRRIDREDQLVDVSFDERVVRFRLEDVDELALAYAATIHKAQGSEYPCVVVPLHTQHYAMLARNLLYTAITRGKKLVVLVGSEKAAWLATRNAGASQRWTRLAERLRAGP
ncbi:MAG TPA: ATP-dependent RecD-like DNA helicase [Myxococcales bacterium]|nr:ATP-dependent RecD-like DNA helicase [Myxococcales bacterium]